jgi:hypothetical protein
MSLSTNERNDVMSRFKSKRFLAVAGVVAVLAGAGAAIAASNGSSTSGNGFLARVAQHLGISTEKLQDATKAAAIDQVDADLKAGRITKAQADELKARINAGQFPFFGGPGRFGFGEFHRGGPDGSLHHQAAADYLGLTAAQLDAKLRSGQSLADVAKAQNKSVDGLKDAILADAKKHLDQAVSDGKMTQAQADAMYNRLKSHIDNIVNGTFPRFRHMRGRPPMGPAPDDGFWMAPAA